MSRILHILIPEISARSSADRALASGVRCHRFDSCRARSVKNNMARDPRIANLDLIHVIDEETGKTESAYFDNISRGGLFILTNDPLPLGRKVRLKFAIALHSKHADRVELHPIDVHGEVIRMIVEEESGRGLTPGMGVRFVDISEKMQQTIDMMVKSQFETTPTN